MKVLRYPPKVLTGDYIRAVSGMLVGFGVLLSVPPSPAIVAVFGSVAGLCSFFGYRTVQRHMTRVAVTDSEICNADFGTRVMAWGELERLKLRYYGTRRQTDGKGGFMQLTLQGAGAKITYESSLESFNYVTWRAVKAARENGVSVDPTSAGNLLTLGFDADSDTPPPES